MGEAFEAGLAGLSDDELVGLLCAARRLSSWQAGMELAAVGELDARRRAQAARPGSSQVGERVSEELAATLMLTARSADSLLGLARQVARIPAVRAGLLAGQIDRARAEVFASELSGLDDAMAAAVGAAFCREAVSMTTGQLRAALRAMVLALDPEAVRRRAERARGEARVEAWQESSGNGALAGRELPAAEMIAADKRIDAIARKLRCAGVPGSLEQLRAAVFVALLTGRDPATISGQAPAGPDSPAASGGPGVLGVPGVPEVSGEPGTPGGPGAHPAPSSATAGPTGTVNLTVPLATWLGWSGAPGEAAGLGPLPAQTCRDLANVLAASPGSRWCLTVTATDGRAVGHACARAGPANSPGLSAWLTGLTVHWLERGQCAHPRRTGAYRPGPVLRHLVKVRQRTCGFPGCRRPAAACDDDHTVPYENGGATCECNLAPLCRRHHQTKQVAGWQLDQPEPGTLVWALPNGRTRVTRPAAYPASPSRS